MNNKLKNPTKDKNFKKLEVENALFELGYALDIEGMNTAAEKLYLQAIEMLEDKATNGNLLELATAASDHGKKLYDIKRYEEAAAAFARAIEVIDSLIVLDADNIIVENLASNLLWHARSLRRLKKYDRACSQYQRACSIWTALKGLTPKTDYSLKLGLSLYGLSKCLQNKKDFELADLAFYSAKNLLNPFINGFDQAV
jgi:tetratricopeptide (TPR) repeat protein